MGMSFYGHHFEFLFFRKGWGNKRICKKLISHKTQTGRYVNLEPFRIQRIRHIQENHAL